MNEAVQNYIAKKQEEAEKHKKQAKRRHLMELGLYEKKYTDNEFITPEYPHCENGKYFDKVPIEVTDEEYEEICKYDIPPKEKNYNTISVILTFIAWFIFIFGFILGYIFGAATGNPLAFAICAASSFISGMFMLGIAEIIKLLDIISKK